MGSSHDSLLSKQKTPYSDTLLITFLIFYVIAILKYILLQAHFLKALHTPYYLRHLITVFLIGNGIISLTYKAPSFVDIILLYVYF